MLFGAFYYLFKINFKLFFVSCTSINFVDFDEDSGVVMVKLQGACSTCSSSKVTLKSGVENMLMHYVPEVSEVVAVDAEEDDNDPVVKAQKAFVEDMTNSAGEQTYKTPAC